MTNLHETIEAALRTIVDPCSIATGAPVNLMDMGLIQSIDIDRDKILVVLRLTSPTCWQVVNIIGAIQEKLAPLPAIRELRCCVDMNAEWAPDMMAPAALKRLRTLRPSALAGSQ